MRARIGGIVGLVGTGALFVVGVIASENIAAWLEAHHLNQLLVLVNNPLVAFVGRVLRALGGPIFTHLYAAVGGALVMLITVAILQAKAESAQTNRLSKPEVTLAEAVRYIASEAAWAQEAGTQIAEQLRLDLTDQLFHGALVGFGRTYDPYGQPGPLFRIDREFWQTARVNVESYLHGGNDNTVRDAGLGTRTQGWCDIRMYRSALEECFPRPKVRKRQA